MIFSNLSITIIFTFTDINGMFHIYIFGISNEITNLKDLYLWTFISIILAIIPFLLLISESAIKEFKSEPVSA